MSSLDRRNRLPELLEPLKRFDPRIRRIAPAVFGGVPAIQVDVGLREMVPLGLLGGGLQRFLTVLLAIYEVPSGVVLIDEIENGLYYAKLKDAWKAIAEALRKESVQLFATTHSHECLRAACQAFSEVQPGDLAVHRLERREDGEVRGVPLDAESLAVALEQNWEVR